MPLKHNPKRTRRKLNPNASAKSIHGVLDGFSYSRGRLYCESVALDEIALAVGTPVYVYSRSAIVNRVRRLQKALEGTDCEVRFAVKACGNISILRLLGTLGCGADIVSGGELFRTALAEIPREKIVFSGVGKSATELSQALDADIGIFNVESLSEAHLLNQIAMEKNLFPRVAFRVNPNVPANTHKHISTGLKTSKFGLSKDELAQILASLKNFRHLNPVGLSCHIGSQISDSKPFLKAWNELKKLAATLPFEASLLNLGGGLAIDYGYDLKKPLSLESYAEKIAKAFKNSRFKLLIEPGRALLGPTCVLLASRIHLKKRKDRDFLVLDAGMNDLIRPALYDARHPIFSIDLPKTDTGPLTVVGPICESADFFSEATLSPSTKLFALGCVGAYGMSMASQYNSRPRPAEVLVDHDTFQVIRRRENYGDLVQHEI